jgi:hypothetical protein
MKPQKTSKSQRWIMALLAVALLGAMTGSVFAASGVSLFSGGNAARAQYGTPPITAPVVTPPVVTPPVVPPPVVPPVKKGPPIGIPKPPVLHVATACVRSSTIVVSVGGSKITSVKYRGQRKSQHFRIGLKPGQHKTINVVVVSNGKRYVLHSVVCRIAKS